MPVPWEALIPFGEARFVLCVESPAQKRRLTRVGHRAVRRRRNAVERI